MYMARWVFLKGICWGQLLVAVTKDENNQMYPIAWAVIGTESTMTWKWFMTILKDDLNLGNGSQLTIISDMQKVIEYLSFVMFNVIANLI